MKRLYGFNSKEIAEELKRQGEAGLRGVPVSNRAIGNEIRIVKLTEDVDPSGTTEENSVEGPYTANEQFFGSDSLVLEEEDTPVEMDVYNYSDESYSEDDIVTVTRWREAWVITSQKDNEWIQFRLKSGWNASESQVGVGQGTGCSTATILASSNAGKLPAGAEVRVYDYKRMFQLAVGSQEHTNFSGGSIGWATRVKTPDGGERFLVTQCTQKINQYKCTFENATCCGLFGEAVTVKPVEPTSVWPFIDPDPSISSGTETLQAFNTHGLAANSKDKEKHVYIRFEQTPNATQTPSNTSAPYLPPSDVGISPIEGRWVIYDVEEPVAQYVTCSWNGETWDFSRDLDVFDGFVPEEDYTLEIEHPSSLNLLGEQTFGGPCLQVGTVGLARIDRTGSTGKKIKYFVIMTSSSLAGEAQQASLVGTLTPSNDTPSEMLVTVDKCDLYYKRVGKAFIFGSPAETADCELSEEEVTQPFTNWNNLDVVETIVDVDGELKMQKKNIKVCYALPIADEPLPTATQDVVTDIACGVEGLEKSYRTLKFIGSSTGGADQVQLPCTDPNNYDWQYIFNNHVYPETWWNVSYYDITWPDGCEPCGTLGCCNYTDANGNPAQESLTQADCSLKSQSTWDGANETCPAGNIGCCTLLDGQGGTISQEDGLLWAECQADFTTEPTAVNWTWVEGSCPASPCEGGTISNFSMSGLLGNDGIGTCYADFTQVGTATIDSSGNATINGTWGGYNGSTLQSQVGSITLSTNGTNWTWTGDISWLSGVTVTGSHNGAGCADGSGLCSSVGGGNSPCDGTWTGGTFSFTYTV